MALPTKIICICLNPTIDRVLRVPEIQGGVHVLGETLLRQPAGKAVNVCRSLARLGSDSMVLGFVGQNEVNWFTHELSAMQPGRINCRWLPLAQPTRESVTLIAADTGLDMHIREPGFTLTAEHWQQLEQALLGEVQPGDLCAFAGSPPRGIQPEQVLSLMNLLGLAGAKLIVDMSGPTLKEILKHPPTGMMLLKPNLSEFAQAIDQPWLTLELLPDQLRHWGQHIPMLMVSLGQQGLMLTHQGNLWHGQVDMDQHQVIDTVGCGDAMLAGCLMQLSRSPHDIPLLITTALSVATANATVVGAGNFDPQFAQSLAPACQVTILPFG